MTRDELLTWLISRVAVAAGLDPREIDPAQPFERYGIASVDVVSISGELEDLLSRSFPETLLLDFPTPEALARHLTGEGTQPRHAAVIEPAPGPVAIVGIGCRIPGAAGPRAFWGLLRDGVDAVAEVPPGRWCWEEVFDAHPELERRTSCRLGGFLDDIDGFDHAFFGIPRREAEWMDPQQRLVLETAWEALEDAGVPPSRLSGTRAGVFIGVSSSDYALLQTRDLERVNLYTGTGNALSITANRLSHFLDLRGPSLAVDTACSSSLVAVHLACESLWRGETQLALVGGVSLMLSPALMVNLVMSGTASPTGRCRAFAADADGIVRGEGAGVVVLKPLARARADGDRVYATILGSAVAQDGRSNGLVAPSGPAQEAVVRDACARARVDPTRIQYVECHGTGTPLGDSVEARALGAVIGAGRPADRPCAIGSVKTNLGHLEAAAGIAGLIKVALALHHGERPASLHGARPSALVSLGALGLRLESERSSWDEPPDERRAGVSAFGFGGTNAHVVLGGAPDPARRPPQQGVAQLLVLSARTPEGLREHAASLREWIASEAAHGRLRVSDVAHTLGACRDHHAVRLAITAGDASTVDRELETYLRKRRSPWQARGEAAPGAQPRLAFVFSGHGAQWWGMGRELIRDEPVVADAVSRCDRLLAHAAGWSLADVFAASEADSRLRPQELEVAQVALFALQVGVAELLRSWGLEPDAVVGHSVGEVAAAHVAGALSIESAVRVVLERSRLLREGARESGESGAMALVELPLERAAEAIAGASDAVSIAAHNSSSSVVLAGESGALDRVLQRLERDGTYAHRLDVPGAGHSPQVAPLLPRLARALEGIEAGRPSLPFHSTVTGAGEDAPLDASYWLRNLREPVRFAEAVSGLIASGHEHFIEVGPHALLTPAIKRSLHEHGVDGLVLACLARDKPERASLLRLAGALYTLGATLDWSQLASSGSRVVSVPTYAWQRERCWFEARQGGRSRQRPASDHSLLGARFSAAPLPGSVCWQTELSLTRFDFLRDHRVEGEVLVPATFYLALALAAAEQLLGPGPRSLADVSFDRALFLSERPEGARRDEQIRILQVVVSPDPPRGWRFEIFSARPRPEPEPLAWTTHARGRIPESAPGTAFADWDAHVAGAIERCLEQVDDAAHYRRLAAWGVDYGPGFRGVASVRRRDGEAIGRVRPTRELEPEADGFIVHPALLDACLQIGAAAVPEPRAAAAVGTLHLPVGLEGLELRDTPSGELVSHARPRELDPAGDEAAIDVRVSDSRSRPLIEARGLRIRRLDAARARPQPEAERDWIYHVRWEQRPLAAGAESPPGCWVVLPDRGGLGEALGHELERRGGQCRLLPAAATAVELERSLLDANAAPARGVVDLRSLDLPDWDLGAPAERARWSGLSPLVDAVRVLAGRDAPPRLLVVTRSAQCVRPGDDAEPLQALAWGLGRSIALEHAELWGGLVDLDPRSTREEAAALVATELCHPGPDDQVAFRSGARLAPRLVRATPAAPAPPLALRGDASYLITGGLGGLGSATARWLVDRGARHLMLTGRTGLVPGPSDDPATRRRAALVKELEAAGASVRVIGADAASFEDMRRVFDVIDREGPPLAGVIHAAGVATPRALVDLDPDAIAQVLAPKAQGAWNLDRLTHGRPLDLFVLFSSAAALWGSSALGHYAAANHLLDALAHRRRAAGCAATSVSWGMWGEAGLATDSRAAAAGELIGLRPMPRSRALGALEVVLAHGSAHAAIAAVDWSEFKPLYEANAPRRKLLERIAPAPPQRRERRPGVLGERLRGLDRSKGVALLARELQRELARALGTEQEALLPDRPLDRLGIDSLLALDLKNHFEVRLGTAVPVALLLRAPSLHRLASELLDLLGGEAPPALDLRAEAVLEEDVVDRAVPLAKRVQPDSIFLTGATGFLGGGILAELLRRTRGCVYCLVRADDDAAAKERVLAALARHARIDPADAARIVVVRGDLAKPALGLEAAAYDHIAGSVDAVVHSGAWLNPVYGYRDLEPVNVAGTREVLRLAAHRRRKTLHHVSSLAVFPWDERADGVVYPEAPALEPEGLPDGYCQTKWAAEQLVTQAGARGLPVAVYRPGLVTGHSASGESNLEDLLSRFLKGCIQLGAMPRLDGMLNLTPVDYASRALVHIALRQRAVGGFFHLVNPVWIPWSEVVECVRRAGHAVELLPYPAWKERVGATVGGAETNVLHHVLPLLQLPESSFTGKRRFSTRRALELLSASGIECPPGDAELLGFYLEHYASSGFLETPAGHGRGGA